MSQRSVSIDVDRSPDAMAAYQLAKTIHRDGGNPTGTFGLLAKVVEDRSWERLRNSRDEPFKSFTAFVETPEPYGLGTTRSELVKLLALRHPREDSDPEWKKRAPDLRTEVARLLNADVEPVALHGTNQHSEGVGAPNSSTPNTAAHIVARLKRHDPELAERVLNDELAPEAAARQKGWRAQRIYLTSPASVAIRLRQHFTPEQVAELRDLLND